MKVYLAARFSRQAEIRDKAGELGAMGIHVTSRWLNEKAPDGGNPSGVMSEVSDSHNVLVAKIDVEDVMFADTLVLFTEDPLVPHVRGGRHFESGLAYGLNKRIITVGPKENIFHFLPNLINVPTWEDAKRLLKEINGNI